jgi:hypothetical protein
LDAGRKGADAVNEALGFAAKDSRAAATGDPNASQAAPNDVSNRLDQIINQVMEEVRAGQKPKLDELLRQGGWISGDLHIHIIRFELGFRTVVRD